MKIRNFAISLLATAALAGCATGYSYRGGAGDYYYGRPSVDYYGYGAPYGSIGYGYPGGYYGSLGYGYGYGYGGYGGYGYPYGYYGYGGYYRSYPHYRHRGHHPRVDRPDNRPPSGYQLPDNGVRYQSRAQQAIQGNPTPAMQPDAQLQYQGRAIPSQSSRTPMRYSDSVPQVPSSFEAGGVQQRPAPMMVPQPSGERIQRSEPREAGEPRFESRAPRFESAPVPVRNSFRVRDGGRVRRP